MSNHFWRKRLENATLRQKGLELMTQPDLAAFISTNEKDANKVKWGQMPTRAILSDRLPMPACGPELTFT
jgi:hypothetical protein